MLPECNLAKEATIVYLGIIYYQAKSRVNLSSEANPSSRLAAIRYQFQALSVSIILGCREVSINHSCKKSRVLTRSQSYRGCGDKGTGEIEVK